MDITKLDLSEKDLTLLPQTRRHSLLAHLLRVPSIVFAINKIDALEAPAEGYVKVHVALTNFAAQAGIKVAAIVPVSALRGDNVTQPLAAGWYDGPSLLQVLENLPTVQEAVEGQLALPVQYIAREGEGTGNQPRTLWGRIAQGQVKAGDTVQILPSGETAVVAEVRRAGEMVAHSLAGESAGVVLDRQLDVSRGDWIVTPGSAKPTQSFEATLAWLDTEPAIPGRKYWLRHGNRWVQARISAIEHKVDIHTLAETEAHELAVNEIGHVRIETQAALPVLPYAANRVGGALIIVDPASNRTSGALLVR